MRIFSKLYDKMLVWSAHPHAPWYLGILSFAESSFFPIPPDVMLAPMTLARPAAGWRLATLTTVTSVLGGTLGYLIGFLAFETVQPFIVEWGYEPAYLQAVAWFNDWGFWAIFIAGFSPIPYKVFTISAGALHMVFAPFVIASFIGRGGRFFLVAGLIRWGGTRMEAQLRRYVDVIGWGVVALCVIGYLVYRFR